VASGAAHIIRVFGFFKIWGGGGGHSEPDFSRGIFYMNF